MSDKNQKVSWFWGKTPDLMTCLPEHPTARWIGGAIALALLVSLGLWLAGAWPPVESENPSDHTRNIVWIYISAIGGILGLLLAFQRTRTATRQADTANRQAETGNRQAETAERGERNSRFQTGAQMLGNEILAVRLGGIYALKTLAENDPKTYLGTVTDLFSAFVRNPPHDKTSFEERPAGKTKTDESEKRSRPYREDISETLKILGSSEWRTGMNKNKIDPRRINLARSDLSKISLHRVDLSETNLFSVNLSKSNLLEVNFSSTDLFSADLREATSIECNFSKATLKMANLKKFYSLSNDFSESDLSNSILSGVSMSGSNWSGAIFSGADLSDSFVFGVDFSQANDLNEKQLEKVIGTPKALPIWVTDSLKDDN